MKKLTNFLVILLSSVVLFSCSYDDSFLKEEIEKMKTDIKSLKEQTTSLKTVVDALNAGKVITNVKKLADDKGYKITFNDGAAIEVLNGEKAPVIGIQESENVYYWTITTNGKTEFLLDKNNHKLPVSGKEGKPGNTPELGIDAEGYWTVNNIRIKDGNGKDIKAEGDSFFKEVKENESEVTFVLADGKTIVIPKVGDTFLYFELPENVQMFVGKPGENLRLRIKFANIDAMEITTKPNQWRVNLHRPDKYVNVSIPKDAKFGVYEVVLRGLDKKGLVFMAVAKISIAAAQGFTDNGCLYSQRRQYDHRKRLTHLYFFKRTRF
ncbi:TonB-dependent receptor [Bacteroides pyogenes JCM 10003]|nr:TonB-dependent receptor [Bacteroides pyogenes JCM 10003]